MAQIATMVHGHPIIAWVRTGVQDGKDCGIILVERRAEERDDPQTWGDYVVAWYRQGDAEWSHGDYCEGRGAIHRAWRTFVGRVERLGLS